MINHVHGSSVDLKYPCVMYFTASWCGPCKRISPDFENLANSNGSIHFYKIDVDDNERLSLIYNITSMPTFVFCKNNDEVSVLKGADTTNLRHFDVFGR